LNDPQGYGRVLQAAIDLGDDIVRKLNESLPRAHVPPPETQITGGRGQVQVEEPTNLFPNASSSIPSSPRQYIPFYRDSTPAQPETNVPSLSPAAGQLLIPRPLQIMETKLPTPGESVVKSTRSEIRCQCPNEYKKKRRHWESSCPYNPEQGRTVRICDLCGRALSRLDSLKRHQISCSRRLRRYD